MPGGTVIPTGICGAVRRASYSRPEASVLNSFERVRRFFTESVLIPIASAILASLTPWRKRKQRAKGSAIFGGRRTLRGSTRCSPIQPCSSSPIWSRARWNARSLLDRR